MSPSGTLENNRPKLKTSAPRVRAEELAVASRTVFMSRAIEQMSTEEAALSLRIPPATVKTRYCRAKLKVHWKNALTSFFRSPGAMSADR
jgi:hypothetical protein